MNSDTPVALVAAVTTMTGEPLDEDVSAEEIFDVLGNRRRRLVLHYLKRTDADAVALGDLASTIAACEHEESIDEVSYDERKAVRTALHQLHLPKMDDVGLLEFDARRSVVTPTDVGTRLEFSLELVERRTLSWNEYFLALSVGMVLSVLLLWQDLFSLAAVPDIAGFALFACLSLALSLAFLYDRRVRQELDSTSLPELVE